MLSNPEDSAELDIPKPPTAQERFSAKATPSTKPESRPADAVARTGISVIGNDLTILGEKITIISQNRLQVDGHVHGDVHGKQVVISKDGAVTGRVCAEKIEVRGAVKGSIRALTVALHESAKVDGDIMHQSLSISEGAEFDGRVQRTKDKNDLIPVLDAEAFASQPANGNGEASHYGNYNGDMSLS